MGPEKQLLRVKPLTWGPKFDTQQTNKCDCDFIFKKKNYESKFILPLLDVDYNYHCVLILKKNMKQTESHLGGFWCNIPDNRVGST